MKVFSGKVSEFFKKLFAKIRKNFAPGPKAISGATAGIFIGFAVSIIVSTWLMLHFAGWGVVIVFILAILLVSFLLGFLGFSLLRLLSKIPFWLAVALIAGIPATVLFFSVSGPSIILVFSVLTLSFAFLGGGIWLIWQNWPYARTLSRVLMIISVSIGSAGIVGGVLWLAAPGSETKMPANAAMSVNNLPDTLNLENPSEQGPYAVGYLSYGSGNDQRRTEFGSEVGLTTETVDGSTFLSSWEGFSGKMRTRFFGFDQEELPLNARVWYPDAQGVFPLVLIVHGNHLAQDFSDPGYEYLGRLLASRGFIMASVDQNFLNGSYANFFNGLNNENDARGWLLLKHLEVWQQWNTDEENPFFGKVDMDNIALMGHSRGGEAAAHAALFNTLPFYPDDANEIFDFQFNIKAVIAIAPCDGQYQPASLRTPLEDINYLVLQGSHDADVSSYQGLRQFNRVTYSDDFDGFKTGLYIWGANHGQFNSGWGKKDGASPQINFFNLRQLMPQEDQQNIAEVYISAFLEAILRGNIAYKPMFMDHRMARHWLPETVYISQYEQARTKYVCTFQEDLDLSTTTIPRGQIDSQDLSIWREESLSLNWGNYDSRVVVLGWNTTENDTLQPFFNVKWEKDFLPASQNPVLVFSMAETGESADPPSEKEDVSNIENDDEKQTDAETDDEVEDTEEDDEPVFIDFTIRVSDSDGNTLEFPLSECSPLQPLLKRQLTKLAFMQTAGESESILQHFYFPLNGFDNEESDFDFESINGIEFIFNITPTGVVAVNNIGFI